MVRPGTSAYRCDRPTRFLGRRIRAVRLAASFNPGCIAVVVRATLGASRLSALRDLLAETHQLPTSTVSEKYCATSTVYGQFEVLRIAGSVAWCQRPNAENAWKDWVAANFVHCRFQNGIRAISNRNIIEPWNQGKARRPSSKKFAPQFEGPRSTAR